METFAARIKEIRKQRKLTQKGIAELANIDVRLYQYYEAGKLCPSLTNAINIADILAVSLDYLTGRSDNPNIN